MFDMGLLIIMIVFMIIGSIVSGKLKRVFTENTKVPTSSGLSGKEIAEKMLRDHKIFDVAVTHVPGQLTDHYNPAKKTVNLSDDVYHGRSVSAAAVAAHECGHAVQHATAYSWLQMRSTLVPVVNFSSRMMNIVFMASLFLAFSFSLYNQMLLVIIVLQGAITLFSLITLPVEIDASQRAIIWLNGAGITRGEEHQRATNALKWAGSTYLVAALASLTTLMYYILRFMGNRD